MILGMLFELPPELEPYRTGIEATIKPCIQLEKMMGEPSLRDSKIGGIPYWPKGMEYPLDSRGKPLYLLAQLNFEQLPKLEGFPQTGLLQFFIAENDVHGMDFDDGESGTGHRVIYHEKILKYNENLETHKASEKRAMLPLYSGSPIGLNGTHQYQAISICDFGFANIFQSKTVEDRTIIDAYGDLHSSHGDRIGGYPDFRQNDPRKMGDERVLLLQLDTDDDLGFMWGDVGVGSFFILPEALECLDFSKVFYYWDCY